MVSEQKPLQFVDPAGQAHVPAAHVAAPGQLVEQSPQCAGSFFRSVHVPKQLVVPAGQPQVPPEHACPAAHDLSHAPQWLGSFFTSMHTPGEPQIDQSVGQAPSNGITTSCAPSPLGASVCASGSVPSPTKV